MCILRDCLSATLLSQEWVKLWTSNFVRTFTGSVRTKAHDIIYLASEGCKCKVVVNMHENKLHFSADVSYRFHHVFIHLHANFTLILKF